MHNYKYNKIGNLVADKSEEIEEISWTMQGKVKEIRRIAGSQKPDLVFNYDGLGNRVSKTVIYPKTIDGAKELTTYYVRDVQGNILATYEKTKYENGDEKFYLKEQYLYGSSRIGMNTSNLLLASNVNGNVEIKEYDGYFTKTVGNKRYELTNHLGNVLAVVSDKKGADNEPDVISLTDYYPFGMGMPGRIYTNPSSSYRFGFQNQEKESELWNGEASFFKYRISDNRLGRFFGVDPLVSEFSWNSSYAFSENRLIDGVELEGREVLLIGKKETASLVLSVSPEVGVLIAPDGVYGYGSAAIGIETNISIATEISVTFYPTMPSAQNASGWGTQFGVAVGELVVGSLNAAYSDGYWGISGSVGLGAGILPVSGSGYATYTMINPISDKAKEATKKLLYQASKSLTNQINNNNKTIKSLSNSNANIQKRLNDNSNNLSDKERGTLLDKLKNNNNTIDNLQKENNKTKEMINGVDASIQQLNK